MSRPARQPERYSHAAVNDRQEQQRLRSSTWKHNDLVEDLAQLLEQVDHAARRRQNRPEASSR